MAMDDGRWTGWTKWTGWTDSGESGRGLFPIPHHPFPITHSPLCKNAEPASLLREKPVRFENLAMSYFPAATDRSIIGAAELNCRVRNGNGWDLRAMVARSLSDSVRRSVHRLFRLVELLTHAERVTVVVTWCVCDD